MQNTADFKPQETTPVLEPSGLGGILTRLSNWLAGLLMKHPPESKVADIAVDAVDAAYSIALNNLRDRYSQRGIEAGQSHFSDVWARDSFFASFGSLSIGDFNVVKLNIDTKLRFMKEDGQIPLRVGQKNMLLKFLGIYSKKTEARFIEDKGISIPSDSNSLFMIVANDYLQASGDNAFILSHFDKIEKAMEWNFTRDDDGDELMEEGHYAGWADSLKKRGKVFYTNVLHYKAITSFAEICRTLGKESLAHHYTKTAERVHAKLNKLFWNGEFYTDWVYKDKRNEYFSTDGNVLAIIFNVASPKQAKAIQTYMKTHGLSADFSVKTNYPQYKLNHVYPLFIPIRIHDYHNGLRWLWLGCVDVVSKHMMGMKEEAKEQLAKIAAKIVEHKGVYEVYDKGKPLKRLFYKSEQGFAWSSGLFVWACQKLGIIPKDGSI